MKDNAMSAVLSPNKRPRLRKLCVVGPCTHKEILDSLRKTYDVTVEMSMSGDEFLNDADMVFYFEDFESDSFKRLHQMSERKDSASGALRLLGPAVLLSKIAKEQDLFAPRPSRPMYCDIMKDVVFALGPDVSDKRRLVDLLHFMGGQVRKEASSSVDILITSQAKGSIYRTVTVMEASSVQPEYVHHCWRNRDVPDFNVMEKTLLKMYEVGTFESLVVAFLGFSEAQLEELSKAVLNNRGTVVSDVASASHVVCNPDNSSSWENITAYSHQKYVTDEWIWSSVHAKKSVGESTYAVALTGKRLDRSRKSLGLTSPCLASSNSRSSVYDLDHSSHSVLNATPEHLYSGDDLESHSSPGNKKVDKKRMVAQEMYETERNYLTALQIMIKFRDVIASETTSDGQPLLSSSDAVLIFGRLIPIVDCHKKICDKLQALLDSWSKSNCNVAKIWMGCADDLDRAYCPYLNNYDTAKGALEKAYASEQFYSFVKTKESSADFNRNLLKDLLIRPVQRLPSVILLLRELQKRSDKDRQKRYYDDAIGAIDRVLAHANQIRATADEIIQVHAKFNEIENVPTYLVKHSRKFLFELDGSIIGYTDPTIPGHFEKKLIRLIVFHDCIMVCKTRDVDQSSNMTMNGTVLPSPSAGGTLRRIARQASLSTLFRATQKRYRYLFYLPLNHVRDLREVRQGIADDQYNMQPLTNDGQAPLFVLNIRSSARDDMLLFHPADVAMMGKIKEHLFTQILMDYNRSIGVDPIHVVDVENLHPELGEVIRKFIKRGNVHNATLMPAPSANYSTMPRPPRPPGGFRKAISSATLSVRNGLHLGRSTTSRSNMTGICESPAGATCTTTFVGIQEEMSTPKKGFRSQLSNSLFRRDATTHLHRRGSDKENRCTDV